MAIWGLVSNCVYLHFPPFVSVKKPSLPLIATLSTSPPPFAFVRSVAEAANISRPGRYPGRIWRAGRGGWVS